MSDARSDFLTRAAAGGMVPFVREVLLDADTPVAAYAKFAAGPFGFLLESLVGGERWARYTFLGTEPREVWRYRGRSVDRWTPKDGWTAQGQVEAPFEHLAGLLRHVPAVEAPGLPRFTGGAVGYLGYELIRSVRSEEHTSELQSHVN